MINFDRYRAIEWTLDRVRSHVGALSTKEVKEDLTSALYVLSVVRSYAQTFDQAGLSEEDKQEVLLGLFNALYR